MFRRKHWKIHNPYSSNRNKVTKIDENGEEITKGISYILQFIDSARFMVSSLSNIVNNLSKGIHKAKCKFAHDDKTVKHMELNKVLRLPSWINKF